MNLAPPIPRFGRGPVDPDATPEREAVREVRRTANRTPAKNPTQVLQRERHEPDYLILMLVVALTAVGILMVYSSSAMRGYISSEADTFATSVARRTGPRPRTRPRSCSASVTIPTT